MRCPLCPVKRGRPKDWTLPDLADHFLESHPLEALTMGREMIKKAGVADTEVIFFRAADEPKTKAKAAEDASDGP